MVAATKLPANLDWQPVADLPSGASTRRRRPSTASSGCFGGIGSGSSSTDDQDLRPGRQPLVDGPGLPLPLHHFTAVTYKGEAVVIGGFVPGDELTSDQSDGVYALRDGTWQKLPSLNHERGRGGAAVVGDKIVVVGGQADGKLVPQTEVFDGERWTDAAEIPTPREHLGAASDGRYLYAVGGRELSAAEQLRRLRAVRPGERALDRARRPCRRPAGGVGVAYAAGRIVVVGGEGATVGVRRRPGLRHRAAQRGRSCRRCRAARHGVAVAVIKDSLYAFGGATGARARRPDQAVRGPRPVRPGAAAPVTANVKWRRVTDGSVEARVRRGGRGRRADLAVRRHRRRRQAAPPRPRPTTGPQHLDAGTAAPETGAPCRRGELPRRGGRDRRLPARSADSASDRVYALRGDRWVPLPPLNHARGAAAAAVVGEKDHRRRRPGRRQARAADRDLRRRGAGPTQPRSPRRGSISAPPRTAATCTRSAGGSCPRPRTSPRSSATTPRETAGRNWPDAEGRRQPSA